MHYKRYDHRRAKNSKTIFTDYVNIVKNMSRKVHQSFFMEPPDD